MSIHNLPPLPAFRDEPADSPIAEIAMRVVVELPNWGLHVVGTATLIAGHLAITAKHVIEHALREFGSPASGGPQITGWAVRLYQVLPGPTYRVWNVHALWTCPHTDIALLHLGLWRTSDPDTPVAWGQPRLRAMPPPIGESVVAFGYRASSIQVRATADGAHHIELNDKPTTSIGLITNDYPRGRDRAVLSFPCFEIEARFDPGMSGGMVIDGAGNLCGLICASLQSDDPTARPISYVTALWPALTTIISADRGGKYPSGVTYPVVDLALDGIVSVVDLAALDPALFPDRTLPGRAK